jgi:hypothetical protein
LHSQECVEIATLFQRDEYIMHPLLDQFMPAISDELGWEGSAVSDPERRREALRFFVDVSRGSKVEMRRWYSWHDAGLDLITYWSLFAFTLTARPGGFQTQMG